MIENDIEFFEIFPWDSNFATGIELIDEQHKELVNILNKLAANLANLSSSIMLNDIFDELAAYADYHFKTEEKIWASHFKNDPWYKEHIKTHVSFMDEVILIKNNKANKPFDDVIHDIVSFLSKWLAYHILDTDKRMAKVVFALQDGCTLKEAKLQADEEMKGLMELLVNTVLNMYESLSSRTLDLMREKALRKKAEQSLHLNEERWKLILDGGLENVWDIKVQYESVFSSDSEEAILDIINNQIIKNQKESMIHPSDIGRVKLDLKDHIDGKTPFYTSKYRLIHKDAGWSWMLSRGKVVNREDDGAIRLVGTNSDITERELASLIYQNSSQAMYVSDVNNNIISINPSFTEITGYSIDEVIGKNPKFLASGKQDKHFYEKMWHDLHENYHWSGEIHNKRKNNEGFSSILNINVVMNEDGLVDHYVALFTDISEKKKADEIILRQASFDSLTQLYNRRIFQIQLDQEIQKSKRNKLPFAMLFVDLDHFKDVNDTLGHEIGDIVLIEASRRIINSIRETDLLGRFGGDEFTIILPALKGSSCIERICEDIISSLSKPFFIGIEQIHISASIGVTLYPDDASSSSELLKNSDQAMYEAKKAGRSRYQYYTSSMQKEAQDRKNLLNDLHSALSLSQFEMYYQPIVNLKNGNVKKAEALLRWNSPVHGLVAPDSFISLAEQSGLIVSIGEWVYKESMSQNKIWKEKFHQEFQMSINKSPVQFRAAGNLLDWMKYMKDLGLSGADISIEITESMLMESEETVLNKLLDFCNEGIEIAIDDFGTGYSSLSYLKRFDVDYIKIDKSFINTLSLDSSDVALCEAMIVMAHKLNIKVIAEGIETKEQHDILIDMGCDFGQGYYFSKPVPAQEFERLYF